MEAVKISEHEITDIKHRRTINISLQQLFDIAAEFALARPTRNEVFEGRKVAVKLISSQIADAESYLSIQEHSGLCPLVFRENGTVTGMLAMLLLNSEGHGAIRSGTFDALDPSKAHLASTGKNLGAVYGWGFAATTKMAGRALVGATAAYQRRAFGVLDCYTRAATADGRRVLEGALGYKPVPWPDETGLIWIPGSGGSQI